LYILICIGSNKWEQISRMSRVDILARKKIVNSVR
jgi:hypothetical protein